MRILKKPYYGWWLVAEQAIAQAITWGVIYYSFSVFIAPMEADLGWSRETITGAFSLALLVSGAMAIPVGFWLDRNGTRLLMTVGITAATILTIAWSQVQSVWAFYGIWVGLGVCMAATLYEPAFAVLAQWFKRQRGLALAIMTFFAGFSSTIFLPLANTLLERSDWRQAVMWLAIMMGVTVIPLHALLLRRHPAVLGLQPDGDDRADAEKSSQPDEGLALQSVLKLDSFWWFALGYTFAMFALSAIRFHLILLMLDKGFTAAFAATATGFIGAMGSIGRLFFGAIESRISRKSMIILIYITQMLGLILLIFNQSTLGIWIFVVLIGSVNGALTLARPALLVDYYGTAAYARISSVIEVAKTIAVTIAPVGAAWLYTVRGNNYDLVLWLLVIIALLSVVAVGFVRRHKFN